MKKLTLALLFTGSLFAQTATFTFGPISPPPYPYPPQQCATAAFDNGSNGSICLAIYPYSWTNLYVPFQYGFPNGGDLTECRTTPNQLGFGTPGFVDNGDGTGSQPFTANSCYDGLNSTITATVQWKRITHISCYRGCRTYYTWVVNGGSGSVVN